MTVLVTGVFDVLHLEHEYFLRQAKALGGRLVVGIESDLRVKKLKGPDRPINAQATRCQNLRDLGIADEVFVLPEQFNTSDDHRALLQKIKPDVLAVSSHSPHIDKKIQLMKEIGGRVEVVHKHNPAVSSTILIERQREKGKRDGKN